MNKLSLLLCITLGLFLYSCDDSSSAGEPVLSSVFVLNEGNFGSANSSITSYDPQSGEVDQDVFQNTNGRPLGDVLQSASRIGDRLFLVVNNSHTVEVVDAESFRFIASISIADQASPRNLIPVTAEKAYVTNLLGNTVSIIDLTELEETGTIPVGSNPEGIARVGDRVYVANSGFGNGNTVSVINTETDQVIDTIEVGDNPVTVQSDASGRVWVVCVGAFGDFNDPNDDTPGEVIVINGEDGSILEEIFIGGHPGDLVLDSEIGKAFLISDSVIEINTTTYEITDRDFIPKNFYAIGLSTGSEGSFLWATDPLNFIQSGKALKYDLNGTAVDSFDTGIIPGAFYFFSEN